MPAQDGATVKISPFRTHAGEPVPEVGVFLLSAGGTAYEIVQSRLMTRSARPHTYDLRCRKLGRGYQFEEGDEVIAFAFSRRDRRVR